MASVITIAFEGWKAQEAASGKPVLLNEFVFANVPNLDPTKPIDRNEKLPPANQIVCRQAVNKAGLASENAVAYSVTLGADVGDFDFNWIGLLNKESGTVAMITHVPIQKKLKTQNGQQGNVLIRSFLLEFQGAAVETQIKTSAETWQIDFTARLAGIDEMQRLINVDNYGAAAFFDDGFEVTRSGEQFTVKKGLGYVGGLRGELPQNQILNGLRNTKIYADFSYQGNIVSQWNTVVKITSAATLANYVDAAGFTHQVFAIASIDANGNITDLRPKGALIDQSLSALEKQLKLDLNKKIDKANITHVKGNSTELVVSQQLLTTEFGKLQPSGNYLKVGDYGIGGQANPQVNNANDATLGGIYSPAGANGVNFYDPYAPMFVMNRQGMYIRQFQITAAGKIAARDTKGAWKAYSDDQELNTRFLGINSTAVSAKQLANKSTIAGQEFYGKGETITITPQNIGAQPAGTYLTPGSFGIGTTNPESVSDANTLGVCGIYASAGESSKNYFDSYTPILVMNRDNSYRCLIQVNLSGRIGSRARTGEWVTYPTLSEFNAKKGLGEGQLWQDVKAGRSPGVTYTNSTGRTIALSVSTTAMISSSSISIFVDNVLCSRNEIGGGEGTNFTRHTIGFAIIPVGSSYRVEASTIGFWAELR